MQTKEIKVGKLRLGGRNPLFLIAGPCVIESEKITLDTARALRDITRRLRMPFIFKSSYDKANRLNLKSYRGPGLIQGLRILARIKEQLKIPVLSDVHCRDEVTAAAKVLNIIQIPALLSRQTDLVLAAARTKQTINLKKGQFLSPYDIKNLISKITSTGNRRILLTERGTCFGYNNLVNDMRAIPIMKSFGYPVIYDATHSVQLPGGQGTSSGGQSELIPYLTRAAVAAGCDGIFLEVHPNPRRALCDGPNMLKLRNVSALLKQLIQIRKALL